MASESFQFNSRIVSMLQIVKGIFTINNHVNKDGVMIRVILASYDHLTPFDLRAKTCRANVE